MKAIWKELLLILGLVMGLLFVGYVMGGINARREVKHNLESLYTHVDETTPMEDYRRYTKLSMAAMAIEWSTGVPEEWR